MKKILKLIVIFIVIILCILIINTIRNVYIINNIHKKSNEYSLDMISYKGIYESHFSYISSENQKTIDEISKKEFFYKDNVYLIKNYKNNQLENIEYQNDNTNEIISNNSDINIKDEFIFLDTMNIEFLIKEDFSNNKMKLYFLNFIKEDNNNYIIHGKVADFYYNKENGMLTKFYIDNNRYEIYSIEKNNVTDTELQNSNL